MNSPGKTVPADVSRKMSINAEVEGLVCIMKIKKKLTN